MSIWRECVWKKQKEQLDSQIFYSGVNIEQCVGCFFHPLPPILNFTQPSRTWQHFAGCTAVPAVAHTSCASPDWGRLPTPAHHISGLGLAVFFHNAPLPHKIDQAFLMRSVHNARNYTPFELLNLLRVALIAEPIKGHDYTILFFSPWSSRYIV